MHQVPATSLPRISTESVAEWRAELSEAHAKHAELDQFLGERAIDAQRGDPEAVEAMAYMHEERATVLRVIEDLNRAIAGGEAELARQVQAEVQAARAAQRAEAERLKALQGAEADRVDAAFAELESAVAAYRELGLQRARAERAAAMNDSRKSKLLGVELERAIWKSAPTTASLLQVDSRMRRHAARLRDQ